ncbi:SdpI family protein [Actinomadura sp. 3N407]|uniref:SdpI family protein n=1 Tax=Actinomadura sp. 3N407 TaxID=3457423 RepID=UPI003FCE82A0
MAIAGIMLACSGVLVGVIVTLAAGGRVTRNRIAGIRTRRSMADDESWLVVHRRALPWSYAAGAAMVAGAVAGHRELRRREGPR